MRATTPNRPSLLPSLGQTTDALTEGPGVPSAARGSRTRRVRLAFALAAALAIGVTGGGAAVAATTFNDTSGTAFENEIEWLAGHDIAQGYPDGSFRPAGNVSRQAFAAYLFRYNSGFEVVTTAFDMNASSKFQYSKCPAGKRPISGGGQTASSAVVIGDSYPTADGGWIVGFNNPAGTAVDTSGYGYVVCMPDSLP